MTSRWKHDRPMSRAGFAEAVSKRRCLREIPLREALANRLRLSRPQRPQSLATRLQALHLRVRCLRPADICHGRNRFSPQPPAASHLVPSNPRRHQPLERHLRAATASPARPGFVQNRLAHAPKVAPRHGRSRSVPPRRPRRSRRKRHSLPHEGRPGRWRPRPEPNRQKLHIIGAVELSKEGHPRRIRLAPLANFSAVSIGGFVTGAVEKGATIISDGFSSYRTLKDYNHQKPIVGAMAAHVVLPWVHRVFANFKRWTLGTYHGVRKPHLQRYLDEFVFRWNRRRHMKSSFDMLLDIAAGLPHAGYLLIPVEAAHRNEMMSPTVTE